MWIVTKEVLIIIQKLRKDPICYNSIWSLFDSKVIDIYPFNIITIDRSDHNGKSNPTVEGWHSQHMVFCYDSVHGTALQMEEKAEACKRIKSILSRPEAKHQAKEGSYAFCDCNGAKGT